MTVHKSKFPASGSRRITDRWATTAWRHCVVERSSTQYYNHCAYVDWPPVDRGAWTRKPPAYLTCLSNTVRCVLGEPDEWRGVLSDSIDEEWRECVLSTKLNIHMSSEIGYYSLPSCMLMWSRSSLHERCYENRLLKIEADRHSCTVTNTIIIIIICHQCRQRQVNDDISLLFKMPCRPWQKCT